jgi:hypothetical protein
LDEVTGRPVIVNIPSSEYIMSNFTVDLSSGVHTPSAVNMPAGMKMLGLVRRA